MKALKKFASIFLRVAISIALLVFVFRANKICVSGLARDIKSADKFLLFSAFVLFIFSYILAFFRWQLLLNTIKANISLRRSAISFCGGLFFNQILLSSIGGDVVRSIDLARHTNKPKEIVASVLLDRLSGYMGLVIVAIFSLIFGWNFVSQDRRVIISVVGLAVLLAVILLALFNRFVYSRLNLLLRSPNAGRIREGITDLHQELHFFRRHKFVLGVNLIFSLLIQIVSATTNFLIALSLGMKVNIIYFLVFIPIVGAISLLPISFGGMGVRETVTVSLFKSAGGDRGLSAGFALVNSSFIFMLAAIGGLVYVLTVHHRRLQHHAPPYVQKNK